jgi:hypothetical protein
VMTTMMRVGCDDDEGKREQGGGLVGFLYVYR